jgi:sigma-54 specific flagellar transcriptional regulator A
VVDIPQLPAKYTEQAPLRASDRREVEASLAAGPRPQDVELPDEGISLSDYLAKIEVALIKRALHATDGVVAHAAEKLRLRRTTLAEKMKRYGIVATTSEAVTQNAPL